MQAASSGPKVSLLIVAIEEVSLPSTSTFGNVLESCETYVARIGGRRKKYKAKGPDCGAEALAKLEGYLPPQR